MPELPEVTEKFVADTRTYSGPLREAAKEADRFGDKNSKAALAARKMGIAAKDAADKAARSMSLADAAAKKLAEGAIEAKDAAEAEARALRDIERSAIAAAEAEHAVARAADDAADNMRQAARDAELAGAAQKLAALKAAGADKTHNLVLGELQAKYGDLSKEGSGAFKAIEQSSTNAFTEVGSSGPGSIALVVAALGAVPFVALAAESAISIGVGGALAGLGLAATKGDKQVQAAMHNMTAHIKSETKRISAPFKQTWIEIAKSGVTAFDSLAPELEKDFAVLAPLISDFAHDAAVAGGKLAPAFDASTKASDKLLHALGDRLPDIAGNVGHSIEIMANSAGQHADEFANLVTNVSALLPVLAHVIDYATQFGAVVNPVFDVLTHGEMSVNALHDGLVKLSGGMISSNHSFQVAEQTFPSFAQQATIAAAGAHQLMTAQQAAALSSQQLKQALDALTGANQNSFDAMTAYRQALLAANAQAKASNAGINGMGKAAIANRSALSQMAGAIRNVMQNANPTSAAIATMRSRFIAAAQGMGVSRSAAIALANKLLGVRSAANAIPGSRKIFLYDNARTVRGHIASLQASINQLHGKTVTVDYIERVHRTLQAERARADGAIDYYADGGTRHDLPPHITHAQKTIYGEPETGGEAFIPLGPSKRERSTELLGQVADMFGLELVKPMMDGAIEKYAKGKVSIGKSEQRQIAKLHAAQARVTLARSRPEYLAAMAAQHALESMRKSVYGGFSRGGLGAPGSAHETVVQHVTHLNVTVQGNVWQTTQLAQELQSVFLRNGMPLSLQPGR